MQITTKRLILRRPTLKDAQDLVDISNNKDIAKMLSSLPYPYTIEDAKEWILKANSKDYIGFVITYKKDIIGVINVDISLRHNHATISYYLAKEYWSMGFMSEAVKGVVEFCFNELNLIRVASHHFHNNLASAKVLKKAGFELEGIRKKHFKKQNSYFDIYDYGILKYN